MRRFPRRCFIWYSWLGSAGGAGTGGAARVADDELGLEQRLPTDGGAGQHLLEGGHQVGGDLVERLAEAGEPRRGECGAGELSKPVTATSKPGSLAAVVEGAQDAESERVGGADDRGGRVAGVEEPVRSGAAGVEVVGLLGVEVAVEPEVAERVEPSLATVAAGLGSRGQPTYAIRRCPCAATCSVAARMPERPSTSTQASSSSPSHERPNVANGTPSSREDGDPAVAGVGAGQHERVHGRGGQEVAVGRDLVRLVDGVAEDEVGPGRARGLGERVQELVEQRRRAVVAERPP